MSRAAVLGAVADRLAARDPGHPLRVGVDGSCGAGKTRFADDLASALVARGRAVIRLDSDGFHSLAAIRRRRTDDPARGYYDDAYDFVALRERVLLPLGPAGSLEYATAAMDFSSDRPVESWAHAAADAVLVFDCTFLQRGELRQQWDEVVQLVVPPDVATARGVARDAAALGGEAAAEIAYATRYAAACAIYEREERPASRASIVVDNTDPLDPRVLR